MTTNETDVQKMFNAEFFLPACADESDPDPSFKTESDNMGDVMERIAEFCNVGDVDMQFLDTYNGFDRYAVSDSFNLRTLGVAIVGVK
jgi:hypothetical protein